MTDQELRDLVAGIAKTQAETAEQMKETDRRKAETDRQRAETDQVLTRLSLQVEKTSKEVEGVSKEVEKTSKQIKQVNKQLGEMGNKFGSFTEGMASPSMYKILEQQFGMNSVNPHIVRKNGRTLEIDLLGYDPLGDRNEAYVVEVKSRLDKVGIDQILRIIDDLPKFEAIARGRKIYGIIAAVEIPSDMYNVAIKKGLYVARISNDTFKLVVPDGFQPKAFGVAQARNGRSNGQAKAPVEKNKTGKK